MQIVIEIPKGAYKELNEAKFPVQDAYRLVAWIKSGIPLPENHGRLIDADDVGNHIIGSVDLRDCPTIIDATESEVNEHENSD